MPPSGGPARFLRRNVVFLTAGAGATLVAVALWRRRASALPGAQRDAASRGRAGSGVVVGPKKGRVAVDAEFFRRLRKLLKICFPALLSKPTMILGLHSAFLVSRTLVSLYIAKLDGALVRALVERKGRMFARLLLWWLTVGWGATFINSQIKFLESKLAISFRTALTEHALKLYMQRDVYYRVGNLDNRIVNADQLLTEDVWQFAQLLSHLYSHLSKPLLDVGLISLQMIQGAQEKGNGWAPPALFAVAAVTFTTRVLRWISPPFGRLVKEQAELDGKYRFVHGRLITNSEEVAFYGGHDVEREALTASYMELVKHTNMVLRKRVGYNIMEGWLLKYLWSAAGYTLVSWPTFFGNATAGQSASERTQDYIVAKGLLTQAADAIERIMSSYKEITELAGYTARVADMITVFDEVGNGVYERPQLAGDAEKLATLAARGEQETSEEGFISLEDVPIVSPTGDTLVKGMSIKLQPGMHCLITGPNGCGKSSLFRILASLWPSYGGRLCKPRRDRIFYVPQRPYMSLGSLRDQVTYPHTAADMAAAGKSDADLEAIMRIVHLTHIVRREGGWDARKTWMDVLSGGEKQRMAMARLFYHMPQFAILDECTSAVSIDVEGAIYQTAKDRGITLLTVTHRPSLWRFHDWLLQFDGEGGWAFTPLNADKLVSLKEEKASLERELADVPAKERRLRELAALVGGDGDGDGVDDGSEEEADA